MKVLEPGNTGLLLLGAGTLLLLSAAFSRVSRVLGVPVVLLFLFLGVLAGSEGIGHIHFEDYALSFRLGTIALVLILFDGGLNTSLKTLRQVRAPAGVLATLGVLATALLLAACVRPLGFSWGEALLLGAIVSSTDAAAIFSVLRTGSVQPHDRPGAVLEAESGLNDPVAVALTVSLTERLAGTAAPSAWATAGTIAAELAIGAVLGVAIGHAGRWLLDRVRPAAAGLYPAIMLGMAALAFGVPTVLHGSGFLAVYVAGIVLGNGPLPHRSSVLRVHDALAWLGQIVMFLALGLLVFPSRLVAVAPVGVVIALVLAVLVRPAVVLACLAPFRMPFNEKLFIGWMGLRGSVPIILGSYPVLAGLPGAGRIFDLVFFVVVVSVLVQGGTARWATRRLGLAVATEPPPPALLDISSTRPLRGDVRSFHIREETATCGVTLSEIPFPEGAGVVMVIRGGVLLPPGDAIVLEPDDHVYVLTRPEDRAFVQLLFGPREPD